MGRADGTSKGTGEEGEEGDDGVLHFGGGCGFLSSTTFVESSVGIREGLKVGIKRKSAGDGQIVELFTKK